jgi:hypothetical protein
VELPSGGFKDIGKVELTPQQRDIFGDVSGHLAYQIMEPFVTSPGWDQLPDAMKARTFQEVFQKTKAAGKEAALSDEQRQAEILRISTEISRRIGH